MEQKNDFKVAITECYRSAYQLAYRSHNRPIFKYWNRNQNRMKALWNQPSNKYAPDKGQPDFLPIIGASCNPAKGIPH
jgi:hypothetical protein